MTPDVSPVVPFIPFQLTVSFGVGPHTGEAVVLTVNGDGSITVSDWDLLDHYQAACMTPRSPDFGLVTLLLAARGHIREVGKAECAEIALRFGSIGLASARERRVTA